MTARTLPDGVAGRAEAVRVLQGGGIVAIPTDTVYGIAVDLDANEGIERLFRAKERPPDRAIALLLADVEQAGQIGMMSEAATTLGRAFWPGGLTIVAHRRADVTLPAVLTGGTPTVGLRVPDHPAPRAIAREVGPLPTTSANRSGEPEARDGAEILERLGHAIDLVLDGGPAHGGPASTVVDCTGARPRLLRVGAIGRDAIVAALAAIDLALDD